MSPRSTRSTRRGFLQAAGTGGIAGVAALGSLAGCVEVSVPEDAIGDDQRPARNTQRPAQSDFDAETRETAKSVGGRVQQSVVKLTAGQTGGTGWVIDDGYVVTNAHVVADVESMEIETYDGTTGTATRVGYETDLRPDVALLRTDVETPQSLSLGSVDSASRGDPVVTVGHPSTVGSWVIALGRYRTYREGVDWVLADVPVASGNSGSPLVSLDGRVLGCVSGSTALERDDRVDRPESVYTAFPDQDRLASAVPAGTVEELVDEWR